MIWHSEDPGPVREILEQLTEAGADLDQEHAFLFFLYLPSGEAARQTAANLEQAGFAVEVSQAEPQVPEWTCRARRSLVPRAAELGRWIETFESLARRHRGVYDGWEVEVPGDGADPTPGADPGMA
jgi:hypothetical protein